MSKKAMKRFVPISCAYGGWESERLSTEPVTAEKANDILMEASLRHAQRLNTSLKSVDESGTTLVAMAHPFTSSGYPRKFYAAEFDSSKEAQLHIEGHDPHDA